MPRLLRVTPAALALAATGLLALAPIATDAPLMRHAEAQPTAQLTAQPPQPAGADNPARAQGPVNPIIRSIDFPGGTLGELLDHIGAQVDLSLFNLVLKDDARDLRVDPIRVRDVTLNAVLELVVPNQSITAKNAEGQWIDYSVQRETIQPDTRGAADARPIHVITYTKRVSQMNQPIRSPRSFRIVSLAELGEDPDRGEYAIETFLDLLARSFAKTHDAAPELGFHEPSSMLITELTSEQSLILDEAYHSYLADERRRQERLTELRNDRAQTLNRIRSAELEAENLRAEIDRISTRLDNSSVQGSDAWNNEKLRLDAHRGRLADILPDLESYAQRYEALTAEWNRLIPPAARPAGSDNGGTGRSNPSDRSDG